MARPDPFTLLFGDLAERRFAGIRDAVGVAATRDAFLLSASALELLSEMRPDEPAGEAIDDFVAFVYAAYRHWEDGGRIVTLDETATRAICRPEAPEGPADAQPGAWYIQLAERVVWGRPMPAGPVEPLDGCFVLGDATPVVIGCFGVHPDRPGLSIARAEGVPAGTVARADGTPLFAPAMPGGREARLLSVTSPAELWLLGWRALAFRENH